MTPEIDTCANRQDYYGAPGLSQSALKDLAISPLRFWHCHVNPNAPLIEPTAEMNFGSALHCAILEPKEFDKRFAREFTADQVQGCLVTIEDLRAWLRDKGHTPKGTRKADLILQVQKVDEFQPILEVLEAEHAAKTTGMIVLSDEAWTRVAGAAASLMEEQRVQELLKEGQPEVALTKTFEGVLLKGLLDWVHPHVTADFKTFAQKRGKSIDQCVADAIYYEGYYRQAVFYAILRGWPDTYDGSFVMPFVESEPPHEVRIKLLTPKVGGQPTVYWTRALLEIRSMIRTYDEYLKQFGDKPWRYAREIESLVDEEMKAMVY
ncbi:MAG TPA: PD-(D/E)XK nuclease-like domain-containing protein [Bryobacteraceae bacterium]|nr:PD-(D/E)XK nuclease-like domain-containing protein [Bryobacteraceae bacterium]